MDRLSRRVTMADVAKYAGVTKTTVSRVLNNKGETSVETRDKVLKAVDELGYRRSPIARSLATDKTLSIGILVPVLSNPYFGAIVEGIENVLWANDYHILLCNSNGNPDREQAVMTLFEDHRVEGVIILSPHSPAEELSKYVRNQPAVVTLNTRVDERWALRVFTDEIQSSSIAVDHLLRNGRRHLAYIGSETNTYGSHERYRGFEQAVKEKGLAFDKAKQSTAVPFSDQIMLPTIQKLLQSNSKIDGLICFNDDIAAKTIKVCTELGVRVPDDIAVIGYDNDALAELITPSLTTLDLTTSKKAVGEFMGRILLEQIENNRAQHDDVILHHRLIVRDSAP